MNEKRKGIHVIVGALLTLVFLAADQIVKILLARGADFGDPAKGFFEGFFHVHPVRNMRSVEEIARKAREGAMSAGFYRALEIVEIGVALLLAVLLILVVFRIMRTAGRDPHAGLVTLLVALAAAMFLCGCADRLFYEGAIDFLCVSFPLGDGSGRGHFAFDVKDVYVFLFGVLTLYYLLRVIVDLVAFRRKDPDGFSSFCRRLRARLPSKRKDGVKILCADEEEKEGDGVPAEDGGEDVDRNCQ